MNTLLADPAGGVLVAASLALGLAQLLTFDARQAALARAAGLKVPTL